MEDILYKNDIKGTITLERVDSITGQRIDFYEDHNVIVQGAKNPIIRAISSPDYNSTINKIKLGNDVGTGTVTNPEPAQDTYDNTTMSVIFDAPYTLKTGYDITRTLVTFNVTIVGSDVLSLYPSNVSQTFTSAALHTGNDTVFAYKRFPQKTISGTVDLNVTWSIHY